MAHGLEKEAEKNGEKPYPPKLFLGLFVLGGGGGGGSSFFKDSGNEVNSGTSADRNPTPKSPHTPVKGYIIAFGDVDSLNENPSKKDGLCFRCVSKDHRGKDCQRSHQCKVNDVD